LNNTGQIFGTPDADIDAPEAWDLKTNASNIIIALLDTGVDRNHPDLSSNLWVNQVEADGNTGIDDDNNGYIDDIYGWDFNDNDNNPDDYQGHGTHCAGIIGAIGNNGLGVTGVCWNVKIMNLKIFPNNSEEGFISGAISAIEYGVNNGARVLNNSWGGGPFSQSLKDAIEEVNSMGVLFVAAAGNDGLNTDYDPLYPACYNIDNIISVMASDAYDRGAWFSNYGPNSVDLAAPGVSIYSCLPGEGYGYMDGTSMSTPYVAGAAALVWAMNSSFGHLQVKDIILKTVDHPYGIEHDIRFGRLCLTGGRLNLYNALQEALREKIFKKTDDVNDSSCIVAGDEITYILSYVNPPIGDPNYVGSFTDVNIIDYLPQDVEFNSASVGLSYDSNSRTVFWHIGTISPGDNNFVTMKVKVKDNILGCGAIVNCCEVKTGESFLCRFYERTSLCCASGQKPGNGLAGVIYIGEPCDINLVWCKGLFAADVNGQDVYFGTDFDEVSRANSFWTVAKGPNDPNVHKGKQSSTKWLAKGLIPYTTYYWRVDEVNDNGPAPGIWPSAIGDLNDDGLVDLNDLNILCQQWLTDGPDADIFPRNNPDGIVNFSDFAKLADDWMTNGSIVWSFTTGIFIDDFERYTSTYDMLRKWTTDIFQEGSGWCSEIIYDSTGATIRWDAEAKNMIYDYNNRTHTADYQPMSALFSEARMESNPAGVDWTAGESNILSISYIGLSTNSADNNSDPNYDRMYVAIRDASGVMGPVVYNTDANAQKTTTWQEWQIPFSELTKGTTLDLTKEVNLIIGFGQRCNPPWGYPDYIPGGSGRVIFDNIRLYNQYSISQSGPSEGFTDDHEVNLAEVSVMSQNLPAADSSAQQVPESPATEESPTDEPITEIEQIVDWLDEIWQSGELEMSEEDYLRFRTDLQESTE
jgi:subtilisin family serine protease